MKLKASALSLLVCLGLSQGAVVEAASAPASVKLLVGQLHQPSLETRLSALKTIAAMGPAAAAAVPAIVDVLNENRAGTASVVGLGKPISPAITDAVLAALTKIGRPAHEAAPYVTPLLRDRNELFRRTQVLETLDAIGPASDSAQTLMRIIGEEGKATYSRALAIAVLGKIEPPPVEASEMLREISEDKTDPRCSAEAKKSLNSILERADVRRANPAPTEAEETELTRLRLLTDAAQSEQVRVEALDKIAELGPKAASLVPAIMPITADKNSRVRHAALGALAAAGEAASVAVPSLTARFLSQNSPEERGYYRRAISKIDPTGKRILPLLQDALEDPFKARFAIEMLNELGTDETTSIAQRARQRWRIK
jgi:hypothetical protein